MTIIAYKGGVIAADTAVWNGDVASVHTIKIARRPDGSLLGGAGTASACATVAERFLKIEDLTKLTGTDDEDTELMMVTPDRKIWELLGKDKSWSDGEFDAIGAGAELAIGAMAAGRSAEQAVAIAIEYHRDCGGYVTSLSHRRGTLRRVPHTKILATL